MLNLGLTTDDLKDELIENLFTLWQWLNGNCVFFKKQKTEIVEDAIKRLKAQPKKGHWEEFVVRGSKTLCCSVCGADSGTILESCFCPNCGADMREDGDGE